jgi:hypothetical protein
MEWGMQRRPALPVALALAALAAAPAASASTLVARDASHVRLRVDRHGNALVEFRTRAGAGHVLYWGAVDASALTFRHDSSGGFMSHRADPRRFRNACRPYGGPPLLALVRGCTARDGSFWVLQSWSYHLKNYGGSRGPKELRLSHFTGELPVLWAKPDWSWRGRYHHLYGQLTYLGKPVLPRKVGPLGQVLDMRGRNVAVDSLDSDMGEGWHRVNAMLAGRPSGEFCLGFTPKGVFTRLTGRSRVNRYRVSVAGPFVAPDVRTYFSGPAPYDPLVDAIANAAQLDLTQGGTHGSCFPQN